MTTLSDSARIFAELFHSITITRQAFITPSLNKNIRPAAYSCVADALLYGENFHEKIKNAKNVEKCGKDLKNINFSNSRPMNKPRRKDFTERRSMRNLNSTGPLRRSYRDFRQSGPKLFHHQTRSRTTR